ncbi:MAG: hypothetical protein WBN86_10450 [Porticoccaceae bacterium]
MLVAGCLAGGPVGAQSGTMCGFSVWQQDYPEVATVHFLDSNPAPYSTIGLRVRSFRLPDDTGNPLIFDALPIRPDPVGSEIFCGLHCH